MQFLGILVLSILAVKFGVCEESVSTIVKQRDIYRLLNYVYNKNYYKDLNDLASGFKFEEWEQWTKPQYAKEFHKYYKEGIPRDAPFSLFDEVQLQQAIALFKTLYYANDYKTFLKIAAWARNNVNPDMYSYALIVAVIHGPHTKATALPPFYEISPYYYYNTEVINEAQRAQKNQKGGNKRITVLGTNYTDWHDDIDINHSIGYFTEDVGVNANYFFNHVMMPFWMDEELVIAKGRGEYFYHYHWQLLARYNLELYSNNMGMVPEYSLNAPMEYGFYPSMVYPNGLSFTNRAANMSASQCAKDSDVDPTSTDHGLNRIKEIEIRLDEFVGLGYYKGELHNKTTQHNLYEDLLNAIMGSAQSPNLEYYGSYLGCLKKLLGCSSQRYLKKRVPSALEHFATALRDPMFWPLHQRVMSYYSKCRQREGPYEHQRISFPGVKIEGLEVDQLTTFFDYMDSDLGNAVPHNDAEFNADSINIKARQIRLNHDPFNYTIKIFAEKPVEAVIKVFLGPRHSFVPEDRKNFVELDRFHQKLGKGENVLHRSSKDSKFFSDDRIMYRDFYSLLDEGVDSNWSYDGEDWPKHYWFPRRLMLPKGTVAGQPFQVYVIANQFFHKADPIEFMVDHFYEFNFPFDRPISSVKDFKVANSYFKNVLIHHKKRDVDTSYSRE